MKRFHTIDGLDGQMIKKPRTAERERIKLACDQCRKRKLKCDDQRPCAACRTRDLPCTSSSLSRGPGRPRNYDVHDLADAALVSNMLDRSAISETLAMEPPETVDLFTAITASSPAASGIGRPDSLDDLIPSLSGQTAASDIQRQTHAEGHTLPLRDFDAAFPPESGIALDEAGIMEWDAGDVDFINGIWELPSLVRWMGILGLGPAHIGERKKKRGSLILVTPIPAF